MSWQLEFNWMCSRLKGKSLITVILKLAWNAFIYAIWRERNPRQFRQQISSEEVIIRSTKG